MWVFTNEPQILPESGSGRFQACESKITRDEERPVVGLDKPAGSCEIDWTSILKYTHDPLDEAVEVVRDHGVESRLNGNPFGRFRGGDDRNSQREIFQELHASAAALEDRDGSQVSAEQERSEVLDRTQEMNPGELDRSRGQGPDGDADRFDSPSRKPGEDPFSQGLNRFEIGGVTKVPMKGQEPRGGRKSEPRPQVDAVPFRKSCEVDSEGNYRQLGAQDTGDLKLPAIHFRNGSDVVAVVASFDFGTSEPVRESGILACSAIRDELLLEAIELRVVLDQQAGDPPLVPDPGASGGVSGKLGLKQPESMDSRQMVQFAPKIA